MNVPVRTCLVAGLLVSALGLVIIWAGAIDLPPVPPGVLIPLVAAALVAVVKARWAAAIAVLATAFLLVGFFASGTGIPNVTGDHGGIVVVGQLVQLVGLLVALVSGLVLVFRRA